MKSGENAWINLDSLAKGGRVHVTVLSNTAEINGHPLPLNQPVAIVDHTKNYFVHTWTGCTLNISAPAGIAADDLVIWIKSSSAYATLTGYNAFRRVLVIDGTMDLAVTLANYKHRHHGGDADRVHVMVNLDCDISSPGVVSIYVLNGTIPPHHPPNLMTDKKLSFFVGCDLDAGLSHLRPLVDASSSVATFYMRCGRRGDIGKIVDVLGVDCIVTTDDLIYHTLRKTDSLQIPVTKASPFINAAPASSAEDVVFRHVFLSDYRTHHFFSSELPHAFERMPGQLVPGNAKGDQFVRNAVHNNCLYAVVRGFDEHLLNYFWGYVLVDYKGRCHSPLPLEFIKQYRLYKVKPMVCC